MISTPLPQLFVHSQVIKRSGHEDKKQIFKVNKYFNIVKKLKKCLSTCKGVEFSDK